jgi:integrase
VIVRLKHIQTVRKPDGRVFHYHRRTRERLPDDPEARARRVLEINAAGRIVPPAVAPGTFADLARAYRGSPEFHRLAASTRAAYEKRIAWLDARWGALEVASIDREAVLALRDRLAARPRQADWMLQVLRLLLNFALDRPSRFGLTHNPAARFRRIWAPSPDANRPWTAAELDAVLAGAAPPIALAVALGAFTGQRLGDVLRMTWTAIRGARIALRQGKTGEDLTIPLHARLRALLAGEKRRAVTIVAGVRGRPLSASGFQTLWQRERRRLGFAAGLTFHGLRHLLAQLLAEAGASEEEIGAVLGHRTSPMIRHYTRRARRGKLAAAALGRIK